MSLFVILSAAKNLNFTQVTVFGAEMLRFAQHDRNRRDLELARYLLAEKQAEGKKH